jgi:site-specific recombinase XerC
MARLSPPKVADKLVPVIADDELAAMLATCKGGGFENRRDAAIIALFKDTGIRLAELAGIASADVDVKDRQAIVTGKGDKQRTVRFTHGTARALGRRSSRARATSSAPSGSPTAPPARLTGTCASGPRTATRDHPRSGSESAAR